MDTLLTTIQSHGVGQTKDSTLNSLVLKSHVESFNCFVLRAKVALYAVDSVLFALLTRWAAGGNKINDPRYKS